MKTKTIVLISVLSVVLFVQEQMFSFLANIQFTVLLIVVFSKTLGTKNTLIVLLIHTLLDTMFMGGMNFLYAPFMFVGWALIPLLLGSLFRRARSPFSLALLGILFSLLFSWVMVIPGTVIQESSFSDYLLADVVFEVLLASSSFISILWLYEPLVRVVENMKGNE